MKQENKVVQFQPPQQDSLATRYLRAIGPVLGFILIYETILAGMQTLLLQVSLENPSWQIYISQHTGTVNTASMAAAMTLASLPFWKLAAEEIIRFGEQWNKAASFGGTLLRSMAGKERGRKNNAAMTSANQGAPAFRWREVEGVGERTDTQMPKENANGIRLLYLALFVGTISLSMGCNIFLSLVENRRNILAEKDTVATILLQIIVFGFLTPLLEEAMFRGVTYSRVKLVAAGSRGENRETVKDVWIACIFTAVLFGLYHANLRQGVYAAVMGVAFAFTYELIGNFAGVWLLHGACNVISVLMSAQFTTGQNAYSLLVNPIWGAAFVGTAAICALAIYFEVNR